MIRIFSVVALGLLLCSCRSDCTVGYKPFYYIHAHDGDMACAAAVRRHRPAISRKSAEKCEAPRRWVEVDPLADDAGRPSKTICK